MVGTLPGALGAQAVAAAVEEEQGQGEQGGSGVPAPASVGHSPIDHLDL